MLALTVASLGAAGAAIDSNSSGGSSPGSGQGSGTGLGEGQSGITPPPQVDPLFDGGLIATAIGILVVLGIATVIVGGVYAVLTWTWSQLRAFLISAGAKLAILAVAGLAFYLFLSVFPDVSGGGSSGMTGQGGEQGMGSVAESAGIDFPMFLGAVALLVVLIVVAVVITRGNDEAAQTVEPSAAEPAERSTPARGTGSSDASPTTGVGNVAADNEVYRSWLALADAAGADVSRDTPADVADRAIERGVDERAAEEITSLFQSVRYGRTGATESEERRARSARKRLASER